MLFDDMESEVVLADCIFCVLQPASLWLFLFFQE